MTNMTRQTIIDYLSVLLCTKPDRCHFVIFAETVREGADFFSEMAQKIPDYVGIEKIGLGRFRTKSRATIHCFSEARKARGRGITLVIILSSTPENVRIDLRKDLVPCKIPIIEEMEVSE
jgi:hypothetical protein